MLKRLRFWLGLLLTLVFLGLFFYKTPFQDIGGALSGANYLWVIPGVLIYFIGFWFRTVRWRLLLEPIGKMKTSRLFSTNIIGYAINNIIPLRIGELVRAYLVGEKEGVSKSAVLGTILVERIFDGLALVFFLMAVWLFIPLAEWLRALAWTMVAIYVGAFAVLVAVSFSERLAARLLGLVTRFLPGKAAHIVERFLLMFISGFKVLNTPAKAGVVFAISVFIWLVEAVMFNIIALSFSLKLPFSAYVLGTATSNLATTLPSTAGGIGPFELLAKQTLVLFNADPAVATAWAIVLHGALLIPVVVVGFIFLSRENLSLAQLTKTKVPPATAVMATAAAVAANPGKAVRPLSIGIIGGGLGGLTAAYRLSRAGHRVTLMEKRDQLGGQAATFEIGGGRIEAFYHHLFVSDTDIIDLIKELDLGDKLVQIDSKVGFCHGGKTYPFVTPLDLLRFSPLSLVDRVRLGLVSLWLQRQADWRKYEGLTAHDWIRKYAGRRNYDVVWGPLLKNKFGESYSSVGMVWFWGKMRLRFGSRSKGFQKEKLVYMEGSFGLLVDALARKIREQGGTILTGTAARKIVVDSNIGIGLEYDGGKQYFDKIIATVPSPALLDIAPGLPADYAAKLKNIKYQTAVCTALTLKQSLSPIYWLNISDPAIPFVAAVEHTNFIDKSHYGGKHVLYLSNYLSPEHPFCGKSAGELLEVYRPHLTRINPAFKPDWVEDCYVFKDSAGQPIIGANYSGQIPDFRTPIKGLYLANTTQIYPEDRGMNYSVRLGNRIAGIVIEDAP